MVIGSLVTIVAMITIQEEVDISPLCIDYPSQIEPDMQWRDDDFTVERALKSARFLQSEFPNWLNRKAERGFYNDGENIRVISGEVWLAYSNT